MADQPSRHEQATLECTERFRKFVRLFEGIERNDRLFPKDCKTCGRIYPSYAHFIRDTLPKGHVMEDCKDVMKTPFTMLYRHCLCGNTLVLTLTEETSPWLDQLWEMLRGEAERTGKPFKELVMEFGRQCDEHIIAILLRSK